MPKRVVEVVPDPLVFRFGLVEPARVAVDQFRLGIAGDFAIPLVDRHQNVIPNDDQAHRHGIEQAAKIGLAALLRLFRPLALGDVADDGQNPVLAADVNAF